MKKDLQTQTSKDFEDKDDDLENWEIKLLDDENQPDFYDTLEVLSLKDNINKVARAVVIVYIAFALINAQLFQRFLFGGFPSKDEISWILWNLFLTLLGTGIDIAIIYFPLKALNQILRILMEMEFNSRKVRQ
jgi:hypothetical protein